MPTKSVDPEFEAMMNRAAMALQNLPIMSGSHLSPIRSVPVTQNQTLPPSVSSDRQAATTSAFVSDDIDTLSGSQTEDLTKRSPLITFLTESDRYVPMFDVITRCLPVSDLLNLKRVSKELQDVYAKAQKSQWNEARAFGNFFKDPTGFRNKLGEVAGLISGIFVLRFLARAGNGNMLDLYATYGPQADALEKYLLDVEGYYVSDEETAPVPSNLNVSRSRKAQTFRSSRDKRLFIYLNHTNSSPMLDILRGDVYSTAATSIMTATKVYSPFANMTFKSDKAYIIRALDQNAQTHLKDIEHARREILDLRFKDRGIAKYRRLNDGDCWVMSLDTCNIATPAVPDYVYDHTDFLFTDSNHRLSPPENIGSSLHYNCLLGPLLHPGLKHTWLGCVEADNRKDAIMRRLDAVVWAQLWKLRGRDRPVNWDEMLRTPLLVREMTGYTGKTFDEKLPEWIKELDDLSPVKTDGPSTATR
ncbi:hypothetical protein BU16DRAFT_554028 [Lophium mytilinum]|uniref:Uncharacterized protein n=1 Tax=Lophium mytilinum TaxID=390894 RepID=A0A6A6RB81_9PEZI|nr:hypothetical protein BU16DRAFT_554028 [Lophium mytilinum]